MFSTKSIIILFLVSLLASQFIAAKEALLKPKNLFILATLKEANFKEHPANLSVNLSLSKHKQGNTVEIKVRCRTFPPGLRDFNEADIEAFIAAGKAAKNNKDFKQALESLRFGEIVISDTEVILHDGKLWIRVMRNDVAKFFKIEETQALDEAMVEARIGKAWYESLLTAEKLPKATAKMRPPRVIDISAYSHCDDVKGKGIDYGIKAEVSLKRMNPRIFIGHSINYENGSISGGGMSRRLEKIIAGVDAIEKKQSYEVKDGDYSFVANLKTKKVEFSCLIDKELNHYVIGYFGRKEVDAIDKNIEKAKVNGKWIIEQRSLFFSKN